MSSLIPSFDRTYNGVVNIEVTLILLCLRSILHHKDRHIVLSCLQKGIDFKRFQGLMIYHRVLTLVYPYLIENGFSRYFDEKVLNQMHFLYIDNAKKNLLFVGLLQKILTILAGCGIKAVPLKGPILAEKLYGDTGARAFSDLDILIPKEEAFKAYTQLIQNGLNPELNLTPKQFLNYQKTREDITLYTTDHSAVAIELHWELSARHFSTPFEFSVVEKNLIVDNFLGAKSYQFSSDDLLVYLCVHGSKHCWYNLESIFLVARLLSDNKDLNWNRVLCLSETIHCKTILLLGLYLADYFFAVPIPTEIQQLLEKNREKLVKLRTYISSVIFRENKKTQWAVSKSKFTFYQIQAMDRLKDKIRYVFFVLCFPTNYDWQAKALPGNLNFLYFFFRPFRLIYNLLMRRQGEDRINDHKKG
jgi:hypothetical protein